MHRRYARTRAFLDSVADDEFDAAIIVIGEVHCAGHEAWPDHTVLLEAYRDAHAVASPSTGRDRTGSPGGMGADHGGMHLPTRSAADRDGDARRVPRAGQRGHGLDGGVVAFDARSREMSQRRYWVVPADLAATGVRCNVVGREPYGRVAPGADFDRVCAELRDALLELREPGTGAPLVREVLRADKIAPGPAPQDFADLHVVWNDTGPLVAAISARVGEVRVELPPMRPGNHVEGGWFVAAGPGITHAVLDHPVSVIDFAPTVASLVGGRFDCDGRPIDELVR